MRIWLLLPFLIAPLLASEKAKPPYHIIIKGSDTLGAKMVPQLAEAYKAEGHNVTFYIAAEGSSTAFNTQLSSSTHIGMSSRAPKESEIKCYKEKGLQLTAHICAYDMIAVIVNEKLKLNNLSKKQVEDIFTGQTRNWKNISASLPDQEIIVYTRNTSSGTYKTFQKLAMNKKDYGKNSQKMAGSGLPMYNVAQSDNSIAYTGLAYARHKGVKPVSINNVKPTTQNATTYPLTRPLYLLTTQETPPQALAFVSWVIESPNASKIIERVGFLPVPKQLQKASSKQLTPLPKPTP